MPDTMFMHEFGNFHIKAAIFGDFHHALFAPPFDSINSIAVLLTPNVA
jgi:hypothetical protein